MNSDHQTKQTIAEISALLTVHPIETSRLLLRPFHASDLYDLYEYLRQKEQQRLSGNPPCDSVDDAKMRLDYMLHADHPQRYFAIVLKAEEELVGNLTFAPYHLLDRDETLRALRGVTLSYILNERYWRRGLMTELLRAVYPFLFEQVKLDYVQAGYFDFNEASGALQRKLGMRLWTEASFEMDDISYKTKEMILFRDEYIAGKNPQKTK